MVKPTLTAQEFIFRVALEPDFREKFLANPGHLSNEYDISEADLQSIKRIDAAKLSKELAGINASELVKIGGLVANHCNDSHTNHMKDNHSQNSHDKGCDDIVGRVIERVVLPEALVAKVKASKNR